MYLTPTDKHWVFDIETDDLNATVIWVMCVENVVTGEAHAFTTYEEIKTFFQDHSDCYFVGHNGINFDAPQVRRLANVVLPLRRIVDTFVLSSLYSPALAGGHSLEAWGIRLKLPKSSFNDFSHLSDEMIKYCQQDCKVTAELFRRLTARMRSVGFTENGCFIEHFAWDIIRRQRENGFAFDLPKAMELQAELQDVKDDLERKLHDKFPAQLLPVKQFKGATRKDGSVSAQFARHLEMYPRLETDPSNGNYTAYDWVEFKVSSPPQRVQKLLELGWKPREFTKPSKTHPSGQPQPTKKGELSPSLREFMEESGVEEVAYLALWMAVTGRLNAVKNWINLYNENTGCIHGQLWLANTLRYKHDKPNTANIPAVRMKEWKDEEGVKHEEPKKGREGLWTYEARDLWTTRDRDKRILVGVDAKGIQLRVLAHYLNDEQFTEAILSEDPHEANRQRLGLTSRPLTKTITYATLMGAGDARIAAEAKVTLKEAKEAKAKFFEQIPGLPKLINRLQSEAKRTGRITLCDGSRILVDKPHTVIPYLLQGDESRIMKMAAIYVDVAVRREKLDVLKCGDIHDEWQNDVARGDLERYLEICAESFAKAGRAFNYNLPIECDSKKGLTWAETH